MKRIVLFYLFLTTMLVQSQTINGTVTVLNDAPNHICKGEDIVIRFKFKYTSGLDPSVVYYFNFQADNLALYVGFSMPCGDFFNLPKSMQGSDTIYTYTHSVQSSVPFGHYLIYGVPNKAVTGRSFNIIDCHITGIDELDQSGENVTYYDMQGNIIEPCKNELIIKQVGNKRYKILIQ